VISLIFEQIRYFSFFQTKRKWAKNIVQAGSLAGAAQLLNSSKVVLKKAQNE